MLEKNNKQKVLWQYPWGYKESFLVVFELLLLGLILQVLFANRIFIGLSWPVNGIAGVILIMLLVCAHIFLRSNPVIKWLSSIPAAVSAISFFTFVILLMGFIPQNNPDPSPVIKLFGLTHIRNSWLLIISGFYLLSSLGLVIIRRSRSLKKRNIGFLCNHAGLWIIIAAGAFGTGDLQRFTSTIYENQGFTSLAYQQGKNPKQLPFEIKLLDFGIEEYPPKIGVVDAITNKFIENNGTILFIMNEDSIIEIGSIEIRTEQFLPQADIDSGGYSYSDSAGSAPAALISVRDKTSGKETVGWISCGSYRLSQNFLSLNNTYIVVMTYPEPQKYISSIALRTNNKIDTVNIEVNKPYRLKGYSLYQMGYDEQLGKWSKLSIIEIIKDPWLPMIYTGILCMCVGAVYLFWIGNEIKKED